MRLFALLIAAFSIGAFAMSAMEKPAVYLSPGNEVAMGGYDPVSYFDGDMTRGSMDHMSMYNGAVWKFASADNLARFENDPAAFAPQYGGYCAWAIAQGYLAKGDPRHGTIVAGKLYLNFNGNIQAKWAQDIPGNIAKANENWPDVLGQ